MIAIHSSTGNPKKLDTKKKDPVSCGMGQGSEDE